MLIKATKYQVISENVAAHTFPVIGMPYSMINNINDLMTSNRLWYMVFIIQHGVIFALLMASEIGNKII